VHFDKFPEEPSFETDPQRELEYTEVSTRFERRIQVDNFVRYHVQHTTRLSFRGIPLSHKEQLDEVTELHRFYAYKHQVLKFLVLNYTRQACKEVVTRLKRQFPGYGWGQDRFDLKALLAELQYSCGAYFRDIRLPHVSSSAVFGPHVDRAELFQMLGTLGSQSAVMTEFLHEKEKHKVLISSDGGLFFYKDLTEEIVLPMVLRLKTDFLDKVLMPEVDEEVDKGPSTDDEADTLPGDLFED
jgi:hypothetical protein